MVGSSGNHPGAVHEAAAERKQQGFTTVKMNATAQSSLYANVRT